MGEGLPGQATPEPRGLAPRTLPGALRTSQCGLPGPGPRAALMGTPPGSSDGNTPRPARVPRVLWLRPVGSTDWRDASHRAQAQSSLLVALLPAALFPFIHLTSLKMWTLRASAAQAPGSLEPFRWLRDEVCSGGGCRRGLGRPLPSPPPPLASSSVSPLYLHPAPPSCPPREHPP